MVYLFDKSIGMEFNIDTIATLVSILIGGGGLLYYKQTKRNKELENENIVITQQKELLQELKTERDEQRAFYESEIKAVRESNNHKREKIEKMQSVIDEKNLQIDTLNSEVARLTVMKCEVHGCVNRQPPSAY